MLSKILTSYPSLKGQIRMTETLKILFFGDLVGRPGRFAVRDYLAENKDNFSNVFVIANVENASHGFGLTHKNYNDILEYGVHCMTSGNHIWDKKEIFNYIDDADRLVRPINYPEGTKGQGARIIDFNGLKIGVVSVLGRVFMAPIESQWNVAIEAIKKLKEITPIVIVDFHAEATAEKVCFARYCSQYGVSAFFGTHTHVQTADEKIFDNMAYITDAGFCGAEDSVIGMDYSTSLNRFLTCMPERYDVADSKNVIVNAVEVEIEPSTGHAVAIRRFICSSNDKEKEKDDEM